MAVGGLTSNATILPSVGEAMAGNAVDDETVAAAAAAALGDVGDDVMGDIHASAEYRSKMLPVFVARAIKAAAERA